MTFHGRTHSSRIQIVSAAVSLLNRRMPKYDFEQCDNIDRWIDLIKVDDIQTEFNSCEESLIQLHLLIKGGPTPTEMIYLN